MGDVEHTVQAAYEPPMLIRLGFVHAETQQFCVFGKQFGGYDGHNFDNMQMPISNCSG